MPPFLPQERTGRKIMAVLHTGVGRKSDPIITFELHSPANIRILTLFQLVIEYAYETNDISAEGDISRLRIGHEWMGKCHHLREMSFVGKISRERRIDIRVDNLSANATHKWILEWTQKILKPVWFRETVGIQEDNKIPGSVLETGVSRLPSTALRFRDHP